MTNHYFAVQIKTKDYISKIFMIIHGKYVDRISNLLNRMIIGDNEATPQITYITPAILYKEFCNSELKIKALQLANIQPRKYKKYKRKEL